MVPPQPPSPWRARLWILAVVTIFGVLIPGRLGIAFLDVVLLGAYVCLGVIFAAPAAAASGQVKKTVLTAAFLTWVMTAMGIITVYLTHFVVVGPDLWTVLECGIFGLALSGAVASCVAYVRKLRSEKVARSVARLILLALLLLFLLESRRLPEVAVPGMLTLNMVWVLFAWLLKKQTRLVEAPPAQA